MGSELRTTSEPKTDRGRHPGPASSPFSPSSKRDSYNLPFVFTHFLWAADCQTQRTLKRDTLPQFRQRPLGWGSQRQDVFWRARAALGLLPQQVRGQGLTAQKLPPHCGLAPQVATADIFPASLAWSRPHLSPLLVPVPLSSSSHSCGPPPCRVATEPVQGHLAISPEWRHSHGPCEELGEDPLYVCPSHLDAAQLWGPSGHPEALLSTRQHKIKRPNERQLFMVTTHS